MKNNKDNINIILDQNIPLPKKDKTCAGYLFNLLINDKKSANDKSAYLAALNEKKLLTLEEAAAYFNIGMNKLRELTNDDHCPYVLWNGSKRLIKRESFAEFLESQYSI